MGNKSSRVHHNTTNNATITISTSASNPPPSLERYFSYHHVVTIPSWWKTPIDGVTPEQLLENETCASKFLLENRLGHESESVEKRQGDMDNQHVHLPVAMTSKQSTPLHHAARLGDNTHLLMLLLSGADVWAADATDNIPLYYACLFGHYISVALLLVKMGGIRRLSNIEQERFIINSLTPEIQNLLKEKVEAKGKSIRL